MTDLWYYAEGNETRGPLSITELVPLLVRVGDPRRVMIWRHGFEDWKAVEDVREVAQQLFRPPPLRSAPPAVPMMSVARTVRGPVVDADDAAQFKSLKPQLTGIGGWLAFLAFGQVIGIARLLVSLGQYYTTMNSEVVSKFPTAIWGEAAMNSALIGLCIYATVLLFRHSRNFPRFFIAQIIIVILFPLADLLWVAFTISLATARPISDFLTLEPKEGGQIIAGVIGAIIWIPYILRSRRVANTFTQ
jgi:hypothetical protein